MGMSETRLNEETLKRNKAIELALFEVLSLRAQALAKEGKKLEASFAGSQEEIKAILDPKEEGE